MSLDTSVDAVAGAIEENLAWLLRQRLLTSIPVQAPAAGVDWSAVVPGGVVREVVGITALLTSSAAVANRLPVVTYSDGANTWWRGQAGPAQAAGLAIPYSWVRGWGAVPANVSTNGITSPLPEDPLGPASVIAAVTSGLQAGDQWSAIVLYVRDVSAEAIVRQGEWLARRFPDFAVQP